MFFSTTRKRTIIVLLSLIFCFSIFSGCKGNENVAENNNIYIVYTNDVHCGYTDHIGYDGLSDYRNELKKKSDNVTLVDIGDAVQGDYMATITKGMFPIDIMNEIGYDLAVIGNHEFDYGIPRLNEFINKAEFSYLSCNIDYKGKGRSPLSQKLLPSKIIDYGQTKIGFIGVTTPYSITSSTPAYFMEDGQIVYDLMGGENGARLQKRVQENVNELKNQGTDYIVVLSHLGDEEVNGEHYYSSVGLAQNTNGIDVILDGHAHNTIPHRVLKNNKNQDVVLSSSGTKLTSIGQLLITADGTITTTVITDYQGKDENVTSFMEEETKKHEVLLSHKIAESEVDFLMTREDGSRAVRNSETMLGNLCADAYRYALNSDIAFINGGSVRAPILKGDITYKDIYALQPFNNYLAKIKISGEELLDVLEFSARKLMVNQSEDGKAVGESGGFLSGSGIRYKINPSIKSPVKVDDNGMFVGFEEGERRISDVEILNKQGVYEPLNNEKEYTMVSHNYMIFDGGDGYNMFSDNQVLIKRGPDDFQSVIEYINMALNGKITTENLPEMGRITIIK